MNKLQKIVAYYCVNYPYNHELSNARLTKMVYLADWFSSLMNRKQLTDIEWIFNHYGPYVEDVIQSIDHNKDFVVRYEQNYYGSIKSLIEFIGDKRDIDLDIKTQEILDIVIEKTRSLNFNKFIDYVYSTYPVRSNKRYTQLSLPYLAKEYAESLE